MLRVWSTSARSPTTAAAPRSTRSLTAVRRSWLRAWTTTSCPSSSSACAARRPRPSVEPVMKTRAIRRSGRGRGGVLLVGDLLAPGHHPARPAGLVGLLDGDVDHEAVRSGAVPVVLAGLEEHAVAGPDDLDRAAFALAEADALGDEDRLAVRMGVPRGAGAGREVHGIGREGRRAGGVGDRVDVDVAGEPVSRAFHRVDARAGDLHGLLPRFWTIVR